MEITKKELITLVSVEITLTEFWETLQNIVDDYHNSDNCKQKILNFLPTDFLKERFVAFCNTYKVITLDVAKEHFENYIVNDISHIVVRIIANNSGYDVNWFGIYNKHTKTINATFQRNGNHI